MIIKKITNNDHLLHNHCNPFMNDRGMQRPFRKVLSLFILYTTWLVPRWDRTTKITVLPVYKVFIYGWPDVVVCCIKMIFLRCCLEDSNLSCVFCWLLLPSWTSRGFEAQPYSPHADDLASTRPYFEVCFRIQINFERWCMALLFLLLYGLTLYALH